MNNEINHKITLPEQVDNLSYGKKVITIDGKDVVFCNGQPEFYSINDIDYKLLQQGFSKIEDLAYSNEQLKSINAFLIDNYRRICTLVLIEGFEYCKWMVYKRNDDILFHIYEVWGADMTIEKKNYLFPFLGGLVDVSEQIKFDPEKFDFEYQFHLYNKKGD